MYSPDFLGILLGFVAPLIGLVSVTAALGAGFSDR